VSTDRAARERFHFLFLEQLLRSSDPSLYALKGGVNLRFFFGSRRYSEDMDLDVNPAVAVETLRKNGYKILDDPALRRVLATQGIVDLQINDRARAKHTETTQRFRLSLVLASGQALPTKVEFSRRGIDRERVRVERIDPEVARVHHRVAYACPHYDGQAAFRQKVEALAGREVTQARDLFDIYLLDSRGIVDPSALAAIDAALREAAAEKLMGITFGDYQGQVVEFLDDDGARDYGSEPQFRALHERVLTLLTTPVLEGA
jgi:predicted nucleotidyltransferase component of viral defense system